MKAKVIIATVIAAGGAIAVASVARHRTPARPEVAAVQPEAPVVLEAPAVLPETAVTPAPPAPTSIIPPLDMPAVNPVPATSMPARVIAPLPKPQPANSKPPAANAPPPHPAVPFGRAALSLVGMDGEAELVWGLTINDPSVPAEARKDLIEDLNEDGFPDPKHLTADDVPLIVNRMALIEQMAPNSMDETNAAAFMEAYKDLLNMLAKVAG